MIVGFLEAIRPFQVRGWAQDTNCPDERLTVEVAVGGELAARALADVFRSDLKAAGHGDGRHAFVVNVDRRLPISEPTLLEVRAISSKDRKILSSISGLQIGEEHAFATLEQENAGRKGTEGPKEMASFPGYADDKSQRPVFVLGAARSGTSAVVQALQKNTRYVGYGEGHLLDVAANLTRAVSAHYRSRTGEWKSRSTLIAAVPEEFFTAGIRHIFTDLARSLFPEGLWLDKTPRPEMIECAPLLSHIWPKGRFIFMKRRAIENVASRARKFTSVQFQDSCADWARSMEAWLTVRSQLKGSALEVDQMFMARYPERVAAELADFLTLTSDEQSRLAEALAYDQPERTSEHFGEALTMESLGLTPELQERFLTLCSPSLEAFGYDIGANYYLPGKESWLIRI